MAPIRPRRPYETRSPSSTCAGRPLPSRPATDGTRGAYVRIRRSRSPCSPVSRYCRHRVWVSSGRLTVKRIRCAQDFSSTPEGRNGQGGEPRGQGERRGGHHPAPRVRARAGDRRSSDGGERRSKGAEKGTERALLHTASVIAGMPRKRRGTIRAPRGVAQLAEHRSPKPGVAGSSPAAPAGQLSSVSGVAARVAVRREQPALLLLVRDVVRALAVERVEARDDRLDVRRHARPGRDQPVLVAGAGAAPGGRARRILVAAFRRVE